MSGFPLPVPVVAPNVVLAWARARGVYGGFGCGTDLETVGRTTVLEPTVTYVLEEDPRMLI